MDGGDESVTNDLAYVCGGLLALAVTRVNGAAKNRHKRDRGRRSEGGQLGQRLLFPTSLHGGGDVHRLAIFGDGAAGDIDAALFQIVDDIIV